MLDLTNCIDIIQSFTVIVVNSSEGKVLIHQKLSVQDNYPTTLGHITLGNLSKTNVISILHRAKHINSLPSGRYEVSY